MTVPSTFMTMKRQIGAKIEATPYTAETLAAADYNFRAFNVAYTPEIESMARKYATGDYSVFASTMGKRMMTISFSVHPSWSGTATTPPECAKLIKACCMKETVGASNVVYKTDSAYNAVPLTIEVTESGCGIANSDLVLKAKGCTGEMKIVLDSVGTPIRFDFEFKGVLVSVTDRAVGSHITAGAFNATEPDAVLAATITAFSDARAIDSVNISLNNQVQMYIDPSDSSGYRGAYVVSRGDQGPSIQLDPYMELIADRADFARWTAGTTGSFSMTAGSHMTIAAPALQITQAYGSGDRNGISVNSISGHLCRISGNDELTITFS